MTRSHHAIRLFSCLTILAAASVAGADEPSHVMLTPADIQWGDAPPNLPPGAKLAVLYGDPSKSALFVVRIKMPAGYKIPAHWHPTDENITVLTGSFSMGMGDKLDAAKAKTYGPGSFLVTPALTRHYAMARGETVVEVAAMGPFGITYVNPDDDPTKRVATGKP